MSGAQPGPTFPARGFLIFGVIILTLLLGGFGQWAVRAEIAGAVIASGEVKVDQNRQIVQHTDGGEVERVLVEEGDRVEAGDVLLRFDPKITRSELSIVENQLFEMMARRGRLEAERDGKDTIFYGAELTALRKDRPEVAELMQGQRRLFEARRQSLMDEAEQLRRRKAQSGEQVTGIEAQRTALSEQIGLLEQELSSKQSLLDRDLVKNSDVLRLRREASRLRGENGELAAKRGEAKGRMTEIDMRILNLQTKRREEAIARLRDTNYRQLELAERRNSLKAKLSRLDLRAPTGGVVYDLQVFGPGSVVKPADPVMYIVPQDRPLVISARVSPINVDEVYPGQNVDLRFPAFDQRHMPDLIGHVAQVSADSFKDERSGQSYFRAEIILDEGELAKLDDQAIVPGMPVQAFIRTGDRTPMAYLIEPLSRYFTKAFREG